MLMLTLFGSVEDIVAWPPWESSLVSNATHLRSCVLLKPRVSLIRASWTLSERPMCLDSIGLPQRAATRPTRRIMIRGYQILRDRAANRDAQSDL